MATTKLCEQCNASQAIAARFCDQCGHRFHDDLSPSLLKTEPAPWLIGVAVLALTILASLLVMKLFRFPGLLLVGFLPLVWRWRAKPAGKP